MKLSTKVILAGGALAVGIYLWRRSKGSPIPKPVLPSQQTPGGVFASKIAAVTSSITGRVP
jgi:hypothetical protein